MTIEFVRNAKTPIVVEHRGQERAFKRDATVAAGEGGGWSFERSWRG